jgi:hypothetical protein
MDLVVAGTELRSIPRKRQKFCIYDAAALDRAVGDVPDAVRAVWDTAKVKLPKTGKRARRSRAGVT